MKTALVSLRLWLAALLVVTCIQLATAATDYTILGTTIVSETRVGRTVFDYQMRVIVRNNGAAVDALALRVSSGAATTSTVVNAVNFGPIAAGATATSADTFTIRVDRTTPFVPAALTWAELPAPPGPSVIDPPSPTRLSSSAISGTAAPGAMVEISGGTSVVTTTADSQTGAFSANVSLLGNRVNRLYAVAIDGGGRRSAPTPIEILQDAQVPSLFIDFPIDGSEVTNETVVVAGRVGDLLSGFMGLEVTVNSQPANVDVGIGQNGTFERGNIALALGANTITARATDVNGNTVSKSITLTRVAIAGPQMAAISGDGQIGRVNTRLSAPVVVRVTEADGVTPIENKLVMFTVTRSDGRLAKSSAASTTPETVTLQVATDASGLARAYWTMGSEAGCGNNRVAVTSRDIAGTINFCASANPAPPSQINIGSGNNQRSETGAPAPLPLRAWVNDSCNGAAGIPVLFTVVSGGGKVNGADVVVVDTSVTGHAEVEFTLGPAQGNNQVEATFAGNPGKPATFVAYGVERKEATPTSFAGLVLNNASQAIGGATCTLQIAGNVSRNTTSGADGRFTFADCPSGTGYVHVNGLTATTAGGVSISAGSYPALSFSIVVVPNADNALPSPVLLPKLNPANARTYDGTRDVVLRCDGIAGLKMTIKAGSMRRFDGSAPTPASPEIITLNQVHHDDIPMPMPDGAAPPFAWTLQPAGATFDPPIAIEYPNMSGLPAGAIAYFLSFNHATERFEIIASGHVTADGAMIVTDPGVGLTLAGWGCNCPPYSVTADCENCKYTCKNKGTIDGGTVDFEKEVVCEGQAVTFNASGVFQKDGQIEKDCPKSGKTTISANGIPKYKWKITGDALATPLEGEGATATAPNAAPGKYTCEFKATLEDPPGAQVSCVPSDERTLPTKDAWAVKVEFITPDGDPVAAPTDSGVGQNEWTFNSSDPSVLTVNFKAKVTPTTAPMDKVKDLVFFTIDDVGSAPVWDAANPGGKSAVDGSNLIATARFNGLPLTNDKLGTKKVTIKCDGTEKDTGNIEVFFPKAEKNHPGTDSGTTPNWYYYWATTAVPGYDLTSGTYSYAAGAAGQYAQYNSDPANPKYIIRGPASAGHENYTSGPLTINRKGIDTCAATLVHEKTHLAVDLANLAGGAWFGKPDGDADEIPDEVEVAQAAAGTAFDKTKKDTWGFIYGDDEEVWCELQAKGTTGVAAQDWANPGKQSKTVF